MLSDNFDNFVSGCSKSGYKYWPILVIRCITLKTVFMCNRPNYRDNVIRVITSCIHLSDVLFNGLCKVYFEGGWYEVACVYACLLVDLI